MKKHVNPTNVSRQDKYISLDQSAKKSLKQLTRLNAKYSPFIALGQYAIRFVNFIYQTDRTLGECTFSLRSISKKIKCDPDTTNVKNKALREIAIVEEEVVKTIGCRKVTRRWLSDKFLKDRVLQHLLSLLITKIQKHLTEFTNPIRLYYGIYWDQEYEDISYGMRVNKELFLSTDHLQKEKPDHPPPHFLAE